MRSQKKSKEDARRQIHRISLSEAFPEDRSIGSAYQKRFQKIRTSDGPCSVSSNKITLAGHTSRTHLHTDQIPFRPIRSFGRIFIRTRFCFVQSDPSDASSYGPDSVSSNQILQTHLHTEQILFNPIKSFGRTSDRPSSVSSNQILRTDFRRTISRLV